MADAPRSVTELLHGLGYDAPVRRGELFVLDKGELFVRFNSKTGQYEAWTRGAFAPEVKESDPDVFLEELKGLL